MANVRKISKNFEQSEDIMTYFSSEIKNEKGVISEKGSLLSHTAIISREIGIPSIVGVKDLMDTVQTGDMIRMNGDKGKIEILKRS